MKQMRANTTLLSVGTAEALNFVNGHSPIIVALQIAVLVVPNIKKLIVGIIEIKSLFNRKKNDDVQKKD